jgi:hypothetical protein
VSPLSLLAFFAAAKKVSPHRGNASKPKAQRGCQRSKKDRNRDCFADKKQRRRTTKS